MLRVSRQPAPRVRGLLLLNLVIEGKDYMAGEVVEMAARDFKYLASIGRVTAAPEETAPLKKAK